MRHPAPDTISETLGKILGYSQRIAMKEIEDYKTQADTLLAAKCRDTDRIRQLLDYMLAFGFNKGMRSIYHRLCVHLKDLDSECAEKYKGYLRDMWDSNDEKQPAKGPAECLMVSSATASKGQNPEKA